MSMVWNTLENTISQFPRRWGAFCLMPCPALTPPQDSNAVTMKFTFWSSGKGGQKPWSLGLFLCIGTTLTLASLEAKCRSNPTTAQTSSPEATLRCNDYSINYSSAPAFHMRYIHPPPFFLVTANLETKDSRNVRNCGIHFSEIVSHSCKIASYIIYLSKTCYSFIIPWQGLDSWEIARLDPHSNCRGFDESICRLVSSACVTGANCVCIGFIICNITCWPDGYSTALMCNIKQLAADWKEYKKLPEGQSGKLPTAGSV